MPMLRKILFATLIIAMAFVTAMACDCVTRSEAESFKSADVVFTGKANRTFTWASRQNTILETDSWLKGNKRERVVISSYLSDCDVSFLNGYTYIVYAKNINGELVTSICAGTAVIAGVGESRPQVVPACVNYDTRLSYGRIAVVTAASVSLSVGFGLLVGTIKRRFRK